MWTAGTESQAHKYRQHSNTKFLPGRVGNFISFRSATTAQFVSVSYTPKICSGYGRRVRVSTPMVDPRTRARFVYGNRGRQTCTGVSTPSPAYCCTSVDRLRFYSMLISVFVIWNNSNYISVQMKSLQRSGDVQMAVLFTDTAVEGIH